MYKKATNHNKCPRKFAKLFKVGYIREKYKTECLREGGVGSIVVCILSPYLPEGSPKGDEKGNLG